MKNEREAAETKRIVEGWYSRLRGREDILADPAGWCRSIGAEPMPEVVRALGGGRPFAEEPAFDSYNEFMAEKLAWRDVVRGGSAPENPAMRKWRERQMRRCMIEIGKDQNEVIIHAPAAFELSRGCSVNCWFCALDAGPLTGVWRHTPENAALWAGVQEAMRDVVGSAARWASSYWATEPLDCPDYESFCTDFHRVHGMYPQTTTAVPLRNVPRTKALLLDSRDKGCFINRFSVHTGGQVSGIFDKFTPMELMYTELLLENDESDMTLVRAGRGFELEKSAPARAVMEDSRVLAGMVAKNPELDGVFVSAKVNTSPLEEGHIAGEGQLQINLPATTSCITGFLVNMCARSVELITPCAADAEWPKGYMVLDRREFADADGFRRAIEGIIRERMPERVENGDIVSIIPRVNSRVTENGFVLSTVFGKIMYEHPAVAAYLSHLGMLLRRGGLAAGYIAMECYYMFSQTEERSMALIQDVFDKGLLDISR